MRHAPTYSLGNLTPLHLAIITGDDETALALIQLHTTKLDAVCSLAAKEYDERNKQDASTDDESHDEQQVATRIKLIDGNMLYTWLLFSIAPRLCAH